MEAKPGHIATGLAKADSRERNSADDRFLTGPVGASQTDQGSQACSGTLSWLSHIDATPAFVYDQGALFRNLALLSSVRSPGGCKVLYSIKAFPFVGLLRQVRDKVDGFSVSSLYEARLAYEILAGEGCIHIATPGLRQQEMPEIGQLCDFVSFNSLNQLSHLGHSPGDTFAAGLRINPLLSFLDDPRYDPCRVHSKLGTPLPQVKKSYRLGGIASTIRGLHFHTHFESRSFIPLETTVRHLENHLPELVRNIDWINLGGGYLFQEADDLQILNRIVSYIRDEWGADVYFEPGKAILFDTGFLVASVIDLFSSDEKTIAVLDTSVNHLPEVFEYQTQPGLVGERKQGAHVVTLAGCTCLSGDLFGDYRLDQPLKLGDRVIFKNVGAYSLAKATRFNGQNLPSIHTLDPRGWLTLLKRYDYQDYYRQWSEFDTTWSDSLNHSIV